MPYPIVDNDPEREASALAHHTADDVKPGAAHPAAYDESLDCRALIDEGLKPKDWIRLFQRLLDDDTTLSAALLLKYRFGLPAPRVSMKRPQAVPLIFSAPEPEHELESPPRTADEILPQPGG